MAPTSNETEATLAGEGAPTAAERGSVQTGDVTRLRTPISQLAGGGAQTGAATATARDPAAVEGDDTPALLRQRTGATDPPANYNEGAALGLDDFGVTELTREARRRILEDLNAALPAHQVTLDHYGTPMKVEKLTLDDNDVMFVTASRLDIPSMAVAPFPLTPGYGRAIFAQLGEWFTRPAEEAPEAKPAP